MAIFEKKWFRLIIFIVLLVATFVSCAVVLFSDAMAGTNSMGGALMFGMLAVAGQLFLFLAFDMLYDVDNGFLRFLRMLFIIIGTLVCVALGVASGLFYSLSPMPELSPWLRGLCGMWLAYGVISFYLYYFADYNFWSDAVIPFIQLIAFAGAYAVSVIFAYVGDAAGDFCYGYPVMIACAVAFVVMCIILKKKGLPFDIDLSLPEVTKNTGSKRPVSNTEAQEKDMRADASLKLFNPLEGAVKTAIGRAVTRLGNGVHGRVTKDKIQWYVIGNKVKVYGEVYYEADSPLKFETYRIDDDMQDLIDRLSGDIEDEIAEEVEKLQNVYINYDNFDESDIKCEVKIKRIK